MMAATEGFVWTCPGGHEVYATFSAAGLVELRRTIADKRPVELFCLRCGVNHRVDDTVVAHIQTWLEHLAKRRQW